MNKEGDNALVEYKIINNSNIPSNLKLVIENTNQEYFKVNAKLKKDNLASSEITTLTIEVILIKDANKTENSEIKGNIYAIPIQK